MVCLSVSLVPNYETKINKKKASRPPPLGQQGSRKGARARILRWHMTLVIVWMTLGGVMGQGRQLASKKTSLSSETKRAF